MVPLYIYQLFIMYLLYSRFFILRGSILCATVKSPKLDIPKISLSVLLNVSYTPPDHTNQRDVSLSEQDVFINLI